MSRKFLAGTATILVFLLFAAVLEASDPRSVLDPPVFRVGAKVYRWKDLCGATEGELKKRFSQETAGMTVQQLQTLTRSKINTRAALENLAWRQSSRGLARSALHTIVLAGIADNILAEQQVPVDEYFDIAKIQKVLREQLRYIDTLCTTPELKEKDDELLGQLERHLGWKWDKQIWLLSRNEIRRYHPIDRWPADFTRYGPAYEEIAVKAVLAHALVEDVCKKGSYRAKANDLALVYLSTFNVYEVHGFTGDRAALEYFFLGSGATRLLPLKAISDWRDTVKKISGTIEVKQRWDVGWRLIDGLSPPKIGEVTDKGSGVYQIVLWDSRFDLNSGSDGGKKGLEFHAKDYAFQMAAMDYFPNIQVYLPEFEMMKGIMLRSLAQEGFTHVAAEMKWPEYKKKVYPAKLFDLFRSSRSRLETFVTRAAAARVHGDKEKGQALVLEVLAAAAGTENSVLAGRYKLLAEQLAKEFGNNAKVPEAKKP